LLAFFTYLKFIQFSEPEKAKTDQERLKQKWVVYSISFALLICALLSKTITASFPAAILLVVWYKKGHITIRDVLNIIPFFIVGIFLGLVTARLEMTQVGAIGTEWSLTFLQRCGVAGRALWFYAMKLIWPDPLIFIYPRWSVEQVGGWYLLFPVLFVCVLFVTFYCRRFIGRGPLLALLFFAGTLFPALGFLNVYPHRFSYVADHFQYLASIGMIALLSASLATWFNKMKPTRFRSVCALIAVIFLLLNLGMKTTIQSRAYKNAATLWQDTIKKNATAFIAYNNLGNYFTSENQYNQAIENYTQALKLKPNFEYAHFNLAGVYRSMGLFKKALRHYKEIVQLYAQGNSLHPTSRPDILPKTHNNIGYIFSKMGRFDQAFVQLNLAVSLRPHYADAFNNLGSMYLKQSKLNNAIDAFRKALSIEPNNAKFHNNIGVTYANANDNSTAIYHFRKALQIKPDHKSAKRNLALAIASLKQNDSEAKIKH
jgi:tetratricopeptide (TPR) repeat protein